MNSSRKTEGERDGASGSDLMRAGGEVESKERNKCV